MSEKNEIWKYLIRADHSNGNVFGTAVRKDDDLDNTYDDLYILKSTHDKEVEDLKEKLRLSEINEAEASCGMKDLQTQVHYFSEHAAAFKQDCDNYEKQIQELKAEIERLKPKESGNNLHLISYITNYIDQSKAELIGYQVYYSNGSNKFYPSINDIDEGNILNSIIEVKQVGKLFK
jgi:predicted nuclease with TOPRIM domain